MSMNKRKVKFYYGGKPYLFAFLFLKAIAKSNIIILSYGMNI